MRTFVLLLLAGVSLAAPASATDLMVVGRDDVLFGPDDVNAQQQRVPVLKKGRCLVAARTPLAALLDSQLELTVRDYGSCGKRARDSSGLYVRGIGGEVARGQDGWVYKVRNRQPSSGAGDMASRTRGRVLWFWCRMGRSGCQRTLDVETAKRSATAGSELTVKVRAYDDDGRAIPARGAKVRIGSSDATATTDAKGLARIEVGDVTGTFSVYATQARRVRSFSRTVRVR